MKKKIWKYHLTHSFTYQGKEAHAITHLYQVGVYVILNDDPAMQFNCSPSKMVSVERKLKKDFEKGIISDLVFGREICVTEDENELLVEVK